MEQGPKKSDPFKLWARPAIGDLQCRGAVVRELKLRRDPGAIRNDIFALRSRTVRIFEALPAEFCTGVL